MQIINCISWTTTVSDDTLNAFNDRFATQRLEDIDPDQLRAFVDEYFSEPGTELESCQLDDWQENPPRLMKIQDQRLRTWALKLNGIWKDLCRKVTNLHLQVHDFCAFCISAQMQIKTHYEPDVNVHVPAFRSLQSPLRSGPKSRGSLGFAIPHFQPCPKIHLPRLFTSATDPIVLLRKDSIPSCLPIFGLPYPFLQARLQKCMMLSSFLKCIIIYFSNHKNLKTHFLRAEDRLTTSLLRSIHRVMI